MSSKAKRITYIYVGRPSFVDKDIRLLREKYDVREYQFRSSNNLTILVSLLRQAIFLLSSVGRDDGIACMFAGYHSLLPALAARIRGIPCFIIAGGTDSVAYPSFGYGNFTKRVYGRFTALSYRWCTMILPVHKTLVTFRNDYYGGPGRDQGFLQHVPGLKTPYTVIPNGFEMLTTVPSDPAERSGFVTVAGIASEKRFILKGIDLIYEVAPRFPAHIFTIVGMTYVPSQPKPKNVRIVGLVDHSDVAGWISTSSHYLQLSISEGHPNALCEGMAAGCIPIGSAVGAIPDIIGDTGFILERRDVDLLYQILRTALGAPASLGVKAQERIKTLYPLSRRRDALVAVIDSYLSPS